MKLMAVQHISWKMQYLFIMTIILNLIHFLISNNFIYFRYDTLHAIYLFIMIAILYIFMIANLIYYISLNNPISKLEMIIFMF